MDNSRQRLTMVGSSLNVDAYEDVQLDVSGRLMDLVKGLEGSPSSRTGDKFTQERVCQLVNMVAEAPGLHEPVVATDPKNDASIAYMKLAREISGKKKMKLAA